MTLFFNTSLLNAVNHGLFVLNSCFLFPVFLYQNLKNSFVLTSVYRLEFQFKVKAAVSWMVVSVWMVCQNPTWEELLFLYFKSSFKFFYFFVLNYFLYIFILFWYIDIKNEFKKTKKNINSMYLKKNTLKNYHYYNTKHSSHHGM